MAAGSDGGHKTDHIVYTDHGTSMAHPVGVDGYQRSFYRPLPDYPYQYDENNELRDKDIELLDA